MNRSTPEEELNKLWRIYASAVRVLQQAVHDAVQCSSCEHWLRADKWVCCGKCQRPRCYNCNEIKLTGCPDLCDFRHCQHCSGEHDCPAAYRSPYAVAYVPQ